MFNLKFKTMKTKILSFIFVLGLGLFMANNVFAQATGTANLGDSKTYTITTSSTLGDWTSGTYAWSIDDVTAIQGGAATLNGSSLSKTVVWVKSGTFTITVIGTDAKGCLTEPITNQITVAAMEACINASGITNQQICSLLTSTATGQADNDETVSFPVTVSNSSVGKTYKIDYKFESGTEVYNGSITNYTPGADITVDINSTAELVTLFSKTNDGNKTVTVTVTGVTQEGTNLGISLCASPTYNITVYEKPAISF